ncbi:MAG: hypothetical protein M1820_004331 [Bogoriella megaspora]|nr:MAG: hypothetical protein M1820_004331 [Bogoriella megaspora]
MGQATHFNRYATEIVAYGAWRYTAESRRLQHVLDKQLSTSDFVAGDRLTIADIAVFIFEHSAKWCGIDIKEYPNVKAWRDKLAQRSAFKEGLQVPAPYPWSDEAVSDPDAQEFYKTVRKYGSRAIESWTKKWQGLAVELPSDYANF